MIGIRFRARYAGACLRCPVEIQVGDLLIWDDDNAVVHAGCVDKAYGGTLERLDAKATTICERCHMTTPCDCKEK